MRIAVLLMPMIAFGLTTAATAEPPIGSRLGDRLVPSKVQEASAARYAHSMAECAVNKRGPVAARLLSATDTASLEAARKALWSGELTCYAGFEGEDGLVEARRFDTPVHILRGLLAEQMLRQLQSKVVALPALPLRQGFYKRQWFAGTNRNAVVDEMGACVADTAPTSVSQLLRSTAYTPLENAAFASLAPVMARCLVAGTKLTGNKQSLRAAMADALYQRAMNPAASIMPDVNAVVSNGQ